MKATLGICLITQAQPLIEDVTFVIEHLQAGLQPLPRTVPGFSSWCGRALMGGGD